MTLERRPECLERPAASTGPRPWRGTVGDGRPQGRDDHDRCTGVMGPTIRHLIRGVAGCGVTGFTGRMEMPGW